MWVLFGSFFMFSIFYPLDMHDLKVGSQFESSMTIIEAVIFHLYKCRNVISTKNLCGSQPI